MKDLEEIQQVHERHIKGFLSAVEDIPGDKVAGEDELSGRGMIGEAEVLAITGRIEGIIRIEELSIVRKMSEAQEFSQRAYKITIGIVASMGLFGSIMAWLMIRSIQVPIQRLKQGTQYISEGIFEKRILISSKDEFGDLARAFNIMTQRLSELEEMKREFIANMSHELRTPLTSIKAATSLMLDQVPGHITDKQKRVLCIIQEEAGKLIRLINSVLDLSRLRAGMMQYHFETGDITALLRTGMANIRFLSELKGIDLILEAEEGLPLIQLDMEKIEQVINNLLSNAVKFTPEGGWIRIKAFRFHSESGREDSSTEPGGIVRVCIEDSGIGMDPDAMPGIFERFRQADPLFGKPVKGTGLGLSICKYYIEEHGGRIWTESERGVGSRFCFDLPVTRKEVAVSA